MAMKSSMNNDVEYLYTKTQSLLPFDEGPSHGIKKKPVIRSLILYKNLH